MSKNRIPFEQTPAVFETTVVPKGTMRVVRAIILNEKYQVLLGEKRKHHPGTKIGKIELLGGRQEDGTNLFDTLCRELREEAGIMVSPFAKGVFVGKERLKHLGGNPYGGMVRQRFGFYGEHTARARLKKSDEHKWIGWVDMHVVLGEIVLGNPKFKPDMLPTFSTLAQQVPNFADRLSQVDLNMLSIGRHATVSQLQLV